MPIQRHFHWVKGYPAKVYCIDCSAAVLGNATNASGWICRRIFVFLRRFPAIKTDLVALLDEWATRFFEELDYLKEGQNGMEFAESMAQDLPQVSCRIMP